MTLSIRRRAATRLRPLIVGLATTAVTAAIAVVAPGIAHAEPPSNDDFDSATAITALPFTVDQDTTQSTKAADDPTSCYSWGSRSVWFDYTAPADGVVRASSTSTGYQPVIAVYTGDRGALTQLPGACTANSGPSEAFHVVAGTTYHILLLEYYAGGQVGFDLTAVPPSPNDAFASAKVTGLPASQLGDLSEASAEPDEVTASCDAGADHSVWYRYTPERTRSVSVTAWYAYSPAISVYRGATRDSLSEVDCVASASYQSSVFTATAGQTYHIRVAADAERAAWFDLRFATAPALTPSVYSYPDRPSVYDEIEFTPNAGDKLGRKFVSGEVRFGDGASAPVTGEPIRHRYAADGDYQVVVTGTTSDGRTGTGVQALKVETHDVALSDLVVPADARVGQTKPITVSVANSRYDENVRFELLRLTVNNQFERVGSLNQWVPASGAKVRLPFAYTYTAADAAAGKVTFKVSAELAYPADDDHAIDNDLVGVTDPVRGKAVRAV